MLVVTGHCLLKFELDGFHSVGASIQAIHTDWSDDHLFTADSDGCVKVGVRTIRQRGDSFPLNAAYSPVYCCSRSGKLSGGHFAACRSPRWPCGVLTKRR